MNDLLGNPITCSNPYTKQVIDNFISLDLNYCDQDPEILTYNDSECPFLNIAKSLLELQKDSHEAPRLALGHLSALKGNLRETLWKAFIETICSQGKEPSISKALELIQEFPTDILAFRYLLVMCLLSGNPSKMLEGVSLIKAVPANLETPEAWSLISFAQLENFYLEEAYEAACRALSMNPHNAWAQHNLGHVHSMNKNYQEAQLALENKQSDWKGVFIYTHNSWHLSLFHLFKGELQAAVNVFEASVIGYGWWHFMNQINILSMLVYLELAGLEIQKYFVKELVEYMMDTSKWGLNSLADVLTVWGLVKAQKPSYSEQLIDNLEGPIKQIAEAVFLLASGNNQEAKHQIETLQDKLVLLGGSVEQRQTLTDAVGITYS